MPRRASHILVGLLVALVALPAFVPCSRPQLRVTRANRRLVQLGAEGNQRGDAQEAVPKDEEPPSRIAHLLEVAKTGDNEALTQGVEENFANFLPEEMTELNLAVGKEGGAGPASRVALALQAALDRRMSGAKEAIEELIANSQGNVNAEIKRCIKKQESALPLLMVLQLNIQQAQQEGDEDKLRAMIHISTVINEEVEKKAPRVNSLIAKLMRNDDAGIRDNLLRHHLGPMEVAAPPDDFDDGTPAVAAALVPPNRLATSFAAYIGEVDRQLKATVGENDETRFETIEKIRIIAKEARLVIGEIYGQGAMDSFGAELTPGFTALMAHKAKQKEQAQESASPASPASPGPTADTTAA